MDSFLPVYYMRERVARPRPVPVPACALTLEQAKFATSQALTSAAVTHPRVRTRVPGSQWGPMTSHNKYRARVQGNRRLIN